MSSLDPERANQPGELLDLVDLEDRVIGTVRKGDTDGSPGLVHREVAILVHRDGELLWQLRSAVKSVMPLTWDIACAGHIGAGDSPPAAARRELGEELGVELELVALERRLVRRPNETYFAYVFAAAAPPALAVTINRDEVAAVEWWSEADYLRHRAAGRALSSAGRELAEAFWAGRWALDG